MTSKTFSKILIFTLFLAGAMSFLFLPHLVFCATSPVLQNLESAGGHTGLIGQGGEAGKPQINQVIISVIQTALDFVGVIFLILMVYAGFLWMLARGNEQRVEKAKTLIEAAVIGIVIVLAAYGISVFVIERILGAGGGGGVSCTPPEVLCTCADGSSGCGTPESCVAPCHL